MFGGETAYPFTVHGELGRPRGRDDLGQTLLLDGNQGIRSNGLDLRNDEMRSLLCHYISKGGAIGHVDHMSAMGQLLPRGIGIPIHGDHLDAKAL